MGLFSWKCAVSEHSIPVPMEKLPERLSQVVMVLPDNGTIEGLYDGYGRIDGVDIFETMAEQLFGIKDRDKAFEGDNYERIMNSIKIVRSDHYNGESYDQLDVSENCDSQGYFYEEEELQELMES